MKQDLHGGDLSDVAASAVRLARRNRPEAAVGATLARCPPTAVDAIPDLPRPLVRLRAETPAHADAQPSSAGAVRLLSSQGFPAERLRRAVEDIHSGLGGGGGGGEAGAAATGFVESWADDYGPWGTRTKGASVDETDLEACARAEVLAQAAGNLRLDANVSFRGALHAYMERDLAVAKEDLFSSLAAKLDPAMAIRSPFLDSSSGFPSSAVRSDRATIGSASSAGSRPPLSGRSVQSDRSAAQQSPFPIGKSPVLSSGRRPRAGQPSARSVATTAPDPDYVSVFRDLVLGLDEPGMIATRMLEHAVEVQDNPHFIACLSTLVELSKVSSTRSDQVQPPASGPSQSDIVCSSRAVLENLFLRYIATVTQVQLEETVTSAAVRSCVHRYVSHLSESGSLLSTEGLTLSSQEIVADGLHFWAQLYFCLRCGCPQAALELATDVAARLEAAGSRFLCFLNEFLAKAPDSQPVSIPGALGDVSTYDLLAEEYNLLAYAGEDPYRRACYVLLARLELASSGNDGAGAVSEISPIGSGARRHPSANAILRGVSRSNRDGTGPVPSGRASLKLREEDYNSMFGSVEDYFWLRLWLCRLPEEAEVLAVVPGFHYVVLSQIQSEVIQCGRNHFDASGQEPLLYAFVLCVIGLVWQAVEFLASIQNAPIMNANAAYLALPLQAMGWVPNEAEYAQVLWGFVLHFATDFPADAAVCIFTLKDEKILRACLQQVVVDTAEYVRLLGDGKGSAGVIEEIASEIRDMERTRGDLRLGTRISHYHSMECGDILSCIQEFRREIASRLAAEYSDSTRDSAHIDSGPIASLMFAVCGDKRGAYLASLRNLARRVTSRDNSVLRDEAIQNARGIVDSSLADGESRSMLDSDVVQELRPSFAAVLEMAEFFDEYWGCRWQAAWGRLSAMGLLPLKTEDISRVQAAYARQPGLYDASVVALLPELLRAALEIAEGALCGDGAASRRETPGAPLQGGPTAEQVMALITFGGLMGLAETELNARLVRLELLLA